MPAAPVTPHPSDAELRRVAEHLAAGERGSATAGERKAAEWIADELRGLGLQTHLETERVVGNFYWPIGLLNGAAVLAALRGGWTGRLLGAVVTGLLFEDLDHRRRLFRRHVLPKRETANVWAVAGEPTATRSLVVVAHHDAAHGGAVFDTTLIRAFAERFPERHARIRRWPPLMATVLIGPVLAALGHRKSAAAFSLGAIVSMVDIGRTPVVPGANDNASSVAAVVELARRLRDEPLAGLRVLLVSTGSEESNSEGMAAWVARHAAELPLQTTTVIALETLGSGHLALAETEGFVIQHPYSAAVKDGLQDAALERGIELLRGMSNAFASDGQIALHAGYPTALLGGMDDLKLPSNYHQPTDTADRLDYDAIARAVDVVETYARRLAGRARA